MIRTQIYLTPDQHRLLRSEAFEKNVSTSEIIRETIEQRYKNKKLNKGNKNIGDWLLFLSREAKQMKIKGPSDLASNMDSYLYGKKR